MSALATAVTHYLFEAKPLWSGQIGVPGVTDASVTTIPLQAATDLTNGNAYIVRINRVSSSGAKNLTSLTEVAIGVLNGTNLINCIRGVEGTAQGFNAGTVVEILNTATHWNKLLEFLGIEHGPDGKHTTGLVTTLKATQAEVAAGTVDNKIVTPLAAAIYGNNSMSRQAIINGNFDVWQRGTSVALADVTNTFLADRWKEYANKDGGTLPTLTRTREILTSGDILNSFYYSRLTTNGAGTSLGANSYHWYRQLIENGVRFLCGLNKKVTMSFWARSSIANKKIGVYLNCSYGTGGSPSSAELIYGTNWTLTSTWTKYTYTFTTNTLVGKTFGTDNNDVIEMIFQDMWGTNRAIRVGAGTTAETFVGSGTIDIAQVQLCAGDVALPFQPKSFEEELRACQRYYQQSYAIGTAPGTATTTNQYIWKTSFTSNFHQTFPTSFIVRMRTAPTGKIYSPATGAIDKMRQVGGTPADVAASLGVTDQVYTGNVSNVSIPADYLMAFHWTAESEL